MAPSEFIRLMKMSTEERLQATKSMHTPKITALLDMAENTLQKYSNVDVDNALFQPFPSEIYFQNFQPTMTYEVALTLRNNDSVSMVVKQLLCSHSYGITILLKKAKSIHGIEHV